MIHTEKHSETVSTGQKAALLLLYSLLVALRDPWLLLHGRLWAEEGTVYLRSAWSSGVSATLFSPHLGYYALWPNFCSLLAAHVFPLQYAALVDTWCSFFIQVFAGWLLLQCEAFSGIRIKSFALLVLLLAAPSRQVWLNSINSQFYLVVCAVIVFLSRSDRRQLLRNFTLAVAGMTGPVTTFLTPFFLLRALFAKTRSAYVQAAVLTTCACTQILVIRESLHAGVRHINFQPSGIAPEYLVEYIVMPFFGRTSKKLALSVILNQMGAYVSTAQTSLGHFKTLVMSYHLPLTWPFLLLWAVVDIAFLALLLWATYDRADRSLLVAPHHVDLVGPVLHLRGRGRHLRRGRTVRFSQRAIDGARPPAGGCTNHYCAYPKSRCDISACMLSIGRRFRLFLVSPMGWLGKACRANLEHAGTNVAPGSFPKTFCLAARVSWRFHAATRPWTNENDPGLHHPSGSSVNCDVDLCRHSHL